MNHRSNIIPKISELVGKKLEKIFVSHISYQTILARTCKELWKFNNKISNNTIRK